MAKQASEEYNLAVLHPEIAKQWHPQKNGDLSPYDVTPGSRKEVWWRCKDNPEHEWLASVGERKRGRNCPTCAPLISARKRIENYIKKRGSLADNYPEIASEWHPSKNGEFKPEKFTSKSNEKVWWLCSSCSHEWHLAICDRHGYGCPSCAGKVVHSDGHNSLMMLNSEVASEWHPEMNGELKPSDLLPSSNKTVHWKCNTCSHVWKSKPNQRCDARGENKYGGGCPCCSGQVVHSETAFNSLEVKVPWILDEWDYERNDISPREILPRSHQSIHWVCKDCDDHWEAQPAWRVKSDFTPHNGCPCCQGQKLHRNGSNSLSTMYPDIAREWHPEKNGQLTPDKVLHGTHKSVWWLCSECNYEWKVPVGSRTGKQKSGCKACDNQAIKPDKSNSLAVVAPWTLAEWNYEKNGDTTPHDVVFRSSSRRWWTCPECDYVFPAVVYSRVNPDGSMKNRCGVCANRVVHPDGRNSLATIRPDLVSEWHSENPDSPHDLTFGSNKVRKWICKEGHVWNAPVARRKLSGCKSCAKFGFKTDYPASIYVLQIETDVRTFYKAGITNRAVNDRMKQIHRSVTKVLSSCKTTKLRDYRFEFGGIAADIEEEINLRGVRYSPGKKFDGYEECYEVDPTELILEIIQRENLSDKIVNRYP